MSKLGRLLALSTAVLLVLSLAMPTLLALERYSGDDRYATAVEISKAGWESGANTIVLARGDDFADALAGVPLAYANEAPVLLTMPNRLPAVTKGEILRLKASRVYILGGLTAVSKEVEEELKELGLETTRISGDNRFDTAAAIADEMAPNGAESVFLAYGLNFPDALAAASYAAISGSPILLTLTGELPEETEAALKALNPNQVFVIGGKKVISDAVFDALTNPERISGSDRYATAVALAQRFADAATSMYIATGLDASGGADAITGAALAARDGIGILLIGKTLPDSVAGYLSQNIYDAIVLGGSSAVSSKVEKAVEGALKVDDDEPEEPGPGPGPGPSKPATSSYKFDYDVPEGIYPAEDVIVDVAFGTKVVGKAGLNSVRFTFEATGPEGSTVTFKATDSSGTEFTFTNEGVWGPESGFALPASYSATTPWTLNFSAAGDYTITFRLINLEAGNAVVVQNSVNIEVIAPWSETTDTAWYNDEENTFTIMTAAELAGFAELVNAGNDFLDKTVQLGADIDLQGIRWTPIGSIDNAFKGTFDGQNYSIRNLRIDEPEQKMVGLFGYVSTPSVLRNISIIDALINAKESVGALAGHVFTGEVENAHVKNVTIHSTHWAGGLLGYAYANVSNCSADNVTVGLVFDTSISDNGDKAGGLIGFLGENRVLQNNTVNDVNITAVRDAGGLLGNGCAETRLINCHVTNGSVSTLDTLGLVHANPWTGGVIGRVSGSGVTLSNCTATDVAVSSYVPEKAGPIVGGPAANWSFMNVHNETTDKWYTTIQDAITPASENDSIIVYPGTYTGAITIDKPISITGSVVQRPVIKGSMKVLHTSTNPTQIKNFEFQWGDSHVITLNKVKNITIQDCSFDGQNKFASNAIQLSSRCAQITLDNCLFKDGYYVTVNGYADDLTVSDCTIENCKSGINLIAGNNLKLTNTDISVIAQGTTNDTYCVRFANDSAISNGLSIVGGSFSVDKNNLVAEAGTYHSAIIIRKQATGLLKVKKVHIDGEVVNTCATELVATLNYWGQESGPSEGQVTGLVDYSPWYTNPEMTTISEL